MNRSLLTFLRPAIACILLASAGCNTRTEELVAPNTAHFEVLNYTDVTMIEFMDSYHGMMATTNKVYFTADGGETWIFGLQISNYEIENICYPGIDTAYAFVSLNTSGNVNVYRTYNLGVTWTQVATLSSQQVAPYFYSGLGGYTWLDQTTDQFWRTTDGAATWNTLGAQGVRMNMYFIDEYTGFAMSGTSFTRTNGGPTAWITEMPSGTVKDYCVLPTLGKIFISSPDGYIYRSDDFGDNFTQIYHDDDGYGVDQITAYPNGLVVAGTRAAISVSKDFGATWTFYSLEGHENVMNCDFYTLTAIQNNVVIATGEIGNDTYIGRITIP